MAAMRFSARRFVNWMLLAPVLGLLASTLSLAQQSGAGGEPLTLLAISPPKGFLRQPYQFQLRAQGGIEPLEWEVTAGSLPKGTTLSRDGLLSGSPTEKGGFHFTVTVRDSGKPAQERKRELALEIVAPLVVEWSRYPRVAGQRVECGVRLANLTGQDFDLTVIVLAVRENGRATAMGYQRFKLKGNTTGVEIPFGENLPNGAYEINVDAVGEVAETGSIFHSRLVTAERLQLQQGP